MIYQRLKEANVNALKNHDTVARSILSVILNKVKLAEIEKRAQNAELTDADVTAVLQKTLKELAEEKDAFEKAGRSDNVKTLSAQMEFVSAFLPKMMSQQEIKTEILKLDDKSHCEMMGSFCLLCKHMSSMLVSANILLFIPTTGLPLNSSGIKTFLPLPGSMEYAI